MFEVPDAVHLLEAVREYLASEVVPSTEGRTSFHARIAVNVLTIVEREILLGPSVTAAERMRRDALGVTSDADLAGMIRRGELDDRSDEVGASLRASAADVLRVTNPAYVDGSA